MRTTKATQSRKGAVRRVLVYIRISKDRKNEISTDVQEKTARRYATDKGWQVVGVYVEKGRGAYNRGNGGPRKELDRLLGDLEAGVGDTVLVYRLDRFSRSVVHFGELWQRLARANAEFVSVTESFDTTTAMGKAMLQIAIVFAELESAIKSERIRDWHEERAARGEVPTGPRSFCYLDERAGIVADEARLTRDAARRLVKGTASVHGLVKEWNAAGWRTTKGNLWSRRTLTHLLTNPHTAGLREIDGELVQGTWKPVLSRKLYDDVYAVLKDPTRRTGTTNTRRYLLTGLIRCGNCGTPMGTKGNTAGARYTCLARAGYEHCGQVSIEIVRTDELVRGAVVDALGAGDLKAALKTADPRTAVTVLEDELDALAHDYGNGGISRSEWEAARKGLERRIADAREAAERPRPVAVNLARFDREPIDAQRRVVQWEFPTIAVRPGRRGKVGFDESRIELTPRPRSSKRVR
jgi:DNA invertase Pin-like site-specific DNA recombinase